MDDFKKDSILEVNCRLLYDYTGYNNIGKLIHNYKLYDSENILFREYKSLKTNAGDNLKDDLHQLDVFYVKLNKDYDRIKIELILSLKEGVLEMLLVNYIIVLIVIFIYKICKEKLKLYYYMYNNELYFPKNIKELNKSLGNKNNKFKIDTIKLLTNYFKKLKKLN